jgi:hypothetical protein
MEKLQQEGFMFLWTINAKFNTSLEFLKQWGYSCVALSALVCYTACAARTSSACCRGIHPVPEYTCGVATIVMAMRTLTSFAHPSLRINAQADLMAARCVHIHVSQISPISNRTNGPGT